MRKGKIIFVILILLTFIITITACNKPKQFTIKFEVDGEVVYSITVDKDTTISAPTNPTKEGYNFGGWYFDKDTLQSPLTTNFNVEDNKNKEIKLYAKWTAKEVQTTIYAITYCNIKDCVNNNKTTFALTDETIILENLPNIKGYKFVEWQDEIGNVVTTISAQTVTQESVRSADCLSLNAVWLAEQYSVSYSNLEGATHTNLSEYNVESEAFLLSDPSKRNGYFFKEWQDENGKKVTKINPLEATNLKLYAVWEVATYNIDYFNENGAVNSNPKMFKHNNKQINLAALECDGYNFLGWFDAEIGGKKIDNIDANSEGNKQFYAHWEAKKYNLTLDNGTIKTVTYKQNYALGIAQEKTGYAFLGWFTAVDCGGEQLTDNEGNSLTVWDKPQYMQLYSGYKAIKYTITFETNFGSEIAPKQLCYKDSLNLENCVTVKDTCNFLGWFLDVNDVNKFEETTMPARNLTLYAKWKQYTLGNLNYNANKMAILEKDRICAELFNATIIDSDGENVKIETTVLGEQKAGNTLQITLTATGKFGVKKQVEVGGVKVFGTPKITYDTTKTCFKLSDVVGCNLWNATCVDSFGEPLVGKLSVLEGAFKGGSYVTIRIECQDILGNIGVATIQNVGVYDVPTATFLRSTLSIKYGENIAQMFSVCDSFGKKLQANVVKNNETATSVNVTVTATDCVGNAFCKAYEIAKEQEKSTLTLLLEGSVVGQKEVIRGETFVLDCNFLGYNFVAWKIDNMQITNGIGASLGVWDKPCGDYNVVADVASINYNINYNLGGATNNLGNPKTYTVKDKITLLNPEKVGYKFLGWQNNGAFVAEIAKGAVGDILLTANWELINYTLTYALDGGVNSAKNVASYNINSLGKAGSITLENPTKQNTQGVAESSYVEGEFVSTISASTFTFLGWFADVEMTISVAEITLQLGNATLYAKWKCEVTTSKKVSHYQRINSDNTPNATGNYILFGEYPQTIKAENITITATQNSKGNFLGSDNCYYAKVVATPFKKSQYVFSNGVNVAANSAYYFKIEPLKWRILSESEPTAINNTDKNEKHAVILCESIIDCCAYSATSNNYEYSDIKSWLNYTFYDTAFSAMQKEIINITTVDNSAKSAGNETNQFCCLDTNDKIFLLSHEELSNANIFGANVNRKKATTDFARSKGIWIDTEAGNYGAGVWWMRSPDFYSNVDARIVDRSGDATNYIAPVSDEKGVVPALTIKL